MDIALSHRGRAVGKLAKGFLEKKCSSY